MKRLVSVSLIMALTFCAIPTNKVLARPDPPPAVAACIVAVIGVACTSVMVYGLWRMCQAIPAPDQDPPAQAPISEIPGIGPPSYMHPLPPLRIRNQFFTARVSLQHLDNSQAGWQTDYTFVSAPSQIGGLAMVAYDANGIALLTNDVPIVSIGGENWAGFDFSTLPTTATDTRARCFRLVGQ